MNISLSSTRSAVRIGRKARQLWQFHARATRLLLHSSSAGEGAKRSRRLYLHVLGELGMEAAPSSDTTTLGRQAARAIRELSRPLWRAALRAGLAALGLLAVLSVIVGLLSWISPTLRHWFFPPDLARTATYKVSSTVAGLPMQGVGTYERGEVFFHTNWENAPHIDMDFGRPIRVREVQIENRRDCCGERALPLNVSAIGDSGERFLCQRRSPFASWTCRAGGAKTQRLRIEVAGPSMLHLHSIEVYE